MAQPADVESVGTMRVKPMLALSVAAAGLLLPVAAAIAAEKGLIIRADDLMAQPFIDAAKSAPVTANQPVDIVERKGAWMRVESGGQSGWVRTLNVRLASLGGAPAPSANASATPLSLLRTGSTGRTVTTGVKGMDETDIRNAAPNYAELDKLNTLTVEPAEAQENAKASNLKENQIAYLNPKGGRR